MAEYISDDATLQTDESPVYHIIRQAPVPRSASHNHHSVSYGIGDLHTNTVENAFSLLKRGVYGTFHKGFR